MGWGSHSSSIFCRCKGELKNTVVLAAAIGLLVVVLVLDVIVWRTQDCCDCCADAGDDDDWDELDDVDELNELMRDGGYGDDLLHLQ